MIKFLITRCESEKNKTSHKPYKEGIFFTNFEISVSKHQLHVKILFLFLFRKKYIIACVNSTLNIKFRDWRMSENFCIPTNKFNCVFMKPYYQLSFTGNRFNNKAQFHLQCTSNKEMTNTHNTCHTN